MKIIPYKELSKILIYAVAFLIFVRVGFFFATMFWPIPNEGGRLTSPIHDTGIDLFYYNSAAVQMAKFGPAGIVDAYAQFYSNLKLPRVAEIFGGDGMLDIREQTDDYIEYLNVGPLFPFLLTVFEYRTDNTIPLALLYLILSICAGFVWLGWMHTHGASLIWLFFFPLLPALNYFSISLGTDLPFMLAMAVFFCSYFRDRWTHADITVWCLAVLVMSLLRPMVLSVLVFIIIDLILLRRRHIRINVIVTTLLYVSILLLLSAAYYLPHGTQTLGSSSGLAFFETSVGDYYNGLFPGWPTILDKTTSLLLMIGAKLLYFLGLRPSFGGTDALIVLMRALPGVILLPGLIWGLVATSWRIRIFLILLLLPVITGPAQDRYNLPIQPLLYFFCGCFTTWCANRMLILPWNTKSQPLRAEPPQRRPGLLLFGPRHLM